MTALEDAAAFASDSRVRGPLMAAMDRAAIDIMSEDPATVHHDQRASLARAVVGNPGMFVEGFAWAASTNPTVVQKWVGDDMAGVYNDLQFIVNSVWNAVAGVVTTA